VHRLLSDRGSATVFVVIALTMILFATLVIATIGGLVVGHRRAQAAADLSALAAASALGTAEDPCAAADAVAAANGASVESCGSGQSAVTIVVSVAGTALSLGGVRLHAEARAGR